MRGTLATIWPSAIGVILAIATLSVPFPFSPTAEANAGHAPISITGDGDFTAANGVTGGIGTPSDPYVIDGWEINATEGPGIGIRIRDTDACFVVRAVHVQSLYSLPGGIGVEFQNVSNGRVENSSFEVGMGLIVRSSSEVRLRGNNISATYWAVDVNGSWNVTVNGNVAVGGEHAVLVTESNNVTIPENFLDSGLWRVLLGQSFSVRVFHNNVLSEVPGWDAIDYDANAWDDGYPSGGNYWSIYRGVDECSGPEQDVCPDPDGIADRPFNLTGAQDRYPLMSPYPVPPVNHPPAAPVMRPAALSGKDLENVTLSWSLSADDGGGENDVVGYEVWTGSAYDSTGSTYGRLAVLPAGATSYTETGAGAGDPADRYYQVIARDVAGYSTAAVEQAGKWSEPLAAGEHLLSVPLEQGDWRVEVVLQTIPWTHVRTYRNDGEGTWVSNARAKAWADLTTLNRTIGFWVNTSADTRWTLAGLVPPSTRIALDPGWNLIGYPKLTPCPLVAVLGTVGYETVEEFADIPPYYLRAMGPFDTVRPGAGYWVLMGETSGSVVVTN